MEGMTAAFEDAGDKVGIYSSPTQWQSIAGAVPENSNLRGLPDWELGADTIAGAEADCKEPSFTDGRIVLAQAAAPAGSIDIDVGCSA